MNILFQISYITGGIKKLGTYFTLKIKIEHLEVKLKKIISIS